MGNLHKAMGSGAAVLDRPFSRLATTKKHQYQRKNIDLCGYHRPDYFAIFVYMCLFSKVATEAYYCYCYYFYYYYYCCCYYYTVVRSIICYQQQSQEFTNKAIYIIVYRKCHAHDFIGNILLTEC